MQTVWVQWGEQGWFYVPNDKHFMIIGVSAMGQQSLSVLKVSMDFLSICVLRCSGGLGLVGPWGCYGRLIIIIILLKVVSQPTATCTPLQSSIVSGWGVVMVSETVTSMMHSLMKPDIDMVYSCESLSYRSGQSKKTSLKEQQRWTCWDQLILTNWWIIHKTSCHGSPFPSPRTYVLY